MTRPKKNATNRNINNVSNHGNTNNVGQDNSLQDTTPERNNNANYDYGHMDENANGHSGASSGSVESLGVPHKMSDMTEIQDRAMMQEESKLESSVSVQSVSDIGTTSYSIEMTGL
jgi:hypothetical protein